jgi:hypothetical protein
MRYALPAAALLFAIALSACDYVRFPGDGGAPPSPPEAGPVTPPDAPGPPPPGFGEEGPVETGETPVDSAPPDPVPAAGDEPVPGSPPGTPVDAAPVPDPAPQPSPEPEPPIEQLQALEPKFSYFGPGQLLAGTGTGAQAQIVHAPGIVFPIKSAPAYLQSQVFSFGGGVAGGDQCDARNFAYPWRDNFCETRTANRTSPFCPMPKIHQGQDIRVGTPEDCNTLRRQAAASRGLHEVVAVEDGIISSISAYNVKLRGEGRIYNYMHLNMNRLAVTAGQSVKAGDLIGYVSNDFGGTPTTLHLHFEIVQNTGGQAWSHVPPYLSLVAAYERREAGPGEQVEPEIGIASTQQVWVIPEGMEIIE